MSNRELYQWVHDHLMLCRKPGKRKRTYTAPYYSTMRQHAYKVLGRIGAERKLKEAFIMSFSEPADVATDPWLFVIASERQLMEAAKVAAEQCGYGNSE